jgi:Fic family protein
MNHQRFDPRVSFESSNTEKIFTLISSIDTVKGQWKLTQKLSPQMIKRLTQSVLITSAGSSNRIEGNKMTDEQIKNLYSKLRIKKFKDRDEQEVAGYIEMLAIVFESYNSIKLNEGTILQFNKEILKYTDKDKGHRGKYKFTSNQVQAKDEKGNIVQIIFDPTPPYLAQKETLELLEWTNWALETNFKHPLIIIANFIFEFLAIHPFEDGNGRTSRVLTNLLLLKTGYEFTPFVSHEKIVESSKVDYYMALNKTQQSWKTEKENIAPFVIFFLEVVNQQAQKALQILSQDDTQSYLSDKQNQVWQYALSADTFSRMEVIRATNLPARTVEESIKKLVNMNKLEKMGEARSTKYKVK